MPISAQQILEELRGHRRTLHELFGANQRKPLPLGRETMLPDEWDGMTYPAGRTMARREEEDQDGMTYPAGRTMAMGDGADDDALEDLRTLRELLREVRAMRTGQARRTMRGTVAEDTPLQVGQQPRRPVRETDWRTRYSEEEANRQLDAAGIANPEERMQAKVLMSSGLDLTPEFAHRRRAISAARAHAQAQEREAYPRVQQAHNNGYYLLPVSDAPVRKMYA